MYRYLSTMRLFFLVMISRLFISRSRVSYANAIVAFRGRDRTRNGYLPRFCRVTQNRIAMTRISRDRSHGDQRRARTDGTGGTKLWPWKWSWKSAEMEALCAERAPSPSHPAVRASAAIPLDLYALHKVTAAISTTIPRPRRMCLYMCSHICALYTCIYVYIPCHSRFIRD